MLEKFCRKKKFHKKYSLKRERKIEENRVIRGEEESALLALRARFNNFLEFHKILSDSHSRKSNNVID